MTNPFESSDDQFAADMLAKARKSRAEPTDPKPTTAILITLVGSLTLALFKIKSAKRGDWWNVHEAAVAVAAMALRIAAEGDPVLGAVPTEENCR